jgi:hypothetical protein
MDHQVRLFEVRKDAKATDVPAPIGGFAVTAETMEDARRKVMARLTSERREVRSLSFAKEGGLVAVVHPPEEITKSERAPRSRRKR